MTRELGNRVALVTGAATGLGEEIARTLGRAGARVVMSDAELGGSDRVCTEIREAGGQAVALGADVTDDDEVDSLVQTALKAFGAIDILVNSAGVAAPSGSGPELCGSRWDRAIAGNLAAAFVCCRAVAAVMMEKGRGKIVNVASPALERMSLFGSAEYTAYNHALVGFSQHLARQLSTYHVCVNVVCPGVLVDGDHRPGEAAPADGGFWAAEMPAPALYGARECTTHDVAQAVAFLSSDRADGLTGQVLHVQGGAPPVAAP